MEGVTPRGVQAGGGFLRMDVNACGRVNAADIAAVKARSGNATTLPTAKWDLNADGHTNATDISIARGRSGQSVR